jgi:hypothetical protein
MKPQDSFRRRVRSETFRGRLPGSRVNAEILRLPMPAYNIRAQWRVQLLRWRLEGSGSPITVAGPRPICTAFPFVPGLGGRDHPRNIECQRTKLKTSHNLSARQEWCQGKLRRTVQWQQPGPPDGALRRPWSSSVHPVVRILTLVLVHIHFEFAAQPGSAPLLILAAKVKPRPPAAGTP